MRRSSAGYNGPAGGEFYGGGRISRPNSTSSGRSGGNTLGKIRKSLVKRLSMSSRRSNSSVDTRSDRAGLEFPSVSASEHDGQQLQHEDVPRVEVVFPMTAPPAPRGAPHGEPLSPIQYVGTAPGSGVTTDAETNFAGDMLTEGDVPGQQGHTFMPTTEMRPMVGSGNGSTSTTTSVGHSAVGAVRVEGIAMDEAVAKVQAGAGTRAARSARAAAEAASRASRAAAAAAATPSPDNGADMEGGGGFSSVEDDDSGFGAPLDRDFATHIWRTQGNTRMLSRVEMSVLSSPSSQSFGRGLEGSSEKSTSTGGTRRSGRAGRKRDGAGGAMRGIELAKQSSRSSDSGREVVLPSRNRSSNNRNRNRPGLRMYNRRHSEGEDRVGNTQDHTTPSSSLDDPLAYKRSSQSSLLATPARSRGSKHSVAPRSAGRRSTHRPRTKKPRESLGTLSSGPSGRYSQDGQRQFEPPGPPKRRWQKWKGNNKFFCNGRLMLGVHYRQLFASTALLVVTWIFFFAFVLPAYGHWYYLLISVCLSIGDIVALGYSSFLDPGIIPRRSATGLPDSVPPDIRNQMNYCTTCHIVRPPRTKHCKHCNNCVLAFDHHCPWTGNCVGARNYRAFMAFIIFVTLSSSFVCTLSILYVLTRSLHMGPEELTDGADVPGSQIISPALSLWTAMITLLVGALLGFHAYLLGKGQTTNEYLRGEKRRGNVPHRSFFPNCRQLWCGQQPPSMLQDMTGFPNSGDTMPDVNYAVNAYTQLQHVMHPRGDMV